MRAASKHADVLPLSPKTRTSQPSTPTAVHPSIITGHLVDLGNADWCTGSAEVIIEPLECVSDERETHFRALLHLLGAPGSLLGLEDSRVVRLIDLVGGEVCRVDGRRKTRLKGSTDPTETFKLDAAEEVVMLDLVGAAATQTVLGVADEAVESTLVGGYSEEEDGIKSSPANQVLGFGAELDVVGEVERLSPVDNLAIRVVAVFGAEGRPADQALKHDGTERPPIAVERIAMTSEDFRRNIIRGAHGRICHQSSRTSPVVNLGPIANSQADLIDGNRVAVVAGSVGFSLEQLLIVIVVVELMEARRQTKVGQLDVAAPVQQDIIGLDITAQPVSVCGSPMSSEWQTDRWMKPSLWTDSIAKTISAM